MIFIIMKIRNSSIFPLSVLLVTFLTLPCPASASSTASLETAKTLFLKGEVAEAISGFQQLPESEEASYWLVRAYLNQDQPGMAITEAEKLYEGNAGSAIACSAMGDIEFRQGHFESAAECYRKAIDSGQEFARAYLGLGKILESEKMLKSAKECFEKAFSLDPDDPDIIREEARYQKQSSKERELWIRYIEAAGYEDPAYLQNLESWLERRKAWSGISLRRIREIPEHASIKLLHFYTEGKYNRYGLKVKINGKKTARLLLDSGSSGIVVKRKFAKSAKVPFFGSENTRGLGDEGDRNTEIGLADTIEIGGLVFENYPISFAGSNISLAEDGLIGTDVFSRFLITLDFNDKKMLLDQLPDPPGIGENGSYSVYDYDWPPGPESNGYSPFRFMHGKVLVPSLINGEEKVHLILDTGASYNVFSHELADRVNYTDLPNMRLGGVSGAIKDVRRVEQITISLAGIEQGSHQTMAIDLGRVSHVLGTEIGGLVGYPFLQRCVIFLDYRTGSLKITPDPLRVKSD